MRRLRHGDRVRTNRDEVRTLVGHSRDLLQALLSEYELEQLESTLGEAGLVDRTFRFCDAISEPSPQDHLTEPDQSGTPEGVVIRLRLLAVMAEDAARYTALQAAGWGLDPASRPELGLEDGILLSQLSRDTARDRYKTATVGEVLGRWSTPTGAGAAPEQSR